MVAGVGLKERNVIMKEAVCGHSGKKRRSDTRCYHSDYFMSKAHRSRLSIILTTMFIKPPKNPSAIA
jgi:hypothetical protein